MRVLLLQSMILKDSNVTKVTSIYQSFIFLDFRPFIVPCFSSKCPISGLIGVNVSNVDCVPNIYMWMLWRVEIYAYRFVIIDAHPSALFSYDAVLEPLCMWLVCRTSPVKEFEIPTGGGGVTPIQTDNKGGFPIQPSQAGWGYYPSPLCQARWGIVCRLFWKTSWSQCLHHRMYISLTRYG